MAKNAKKDETTPRFPYTSTPNSFRKFLRLIPNKPKPNKVTGRLLESWGLTSSNDRYIIPMLKALNFISSSGDTTSNYEAFMHKSTGAATMGAQIKRLYAPLFQTSHEPHKDSNEDLKRLFNIHSGGSERTIRYQIEAFKALCEFASFDGVASDNSVQINGQSEDKIGAAAVRQESFTSGGPTIHINLHIHLPENKTTREYEAIIQDIARYIYKQEDSPNGK